MSTIILPITRLIHQSIRRLTHFGWHIDRHLTDMSTDILVDTRPICQPIHRSSVGWYVDRDVDQYIGRGVHKIHMIHFCIREARLHICYLPAGRSVLGKTVPEVLSTAWGRRPRAVPKTKGTVFPNTDQPRPANNMFIIFFRRVLCKQFLCWIFTAAIFKPGVSVHLTLRNRKSNQHYTHWLKLGNCLFLRSLFTFYVLCSEKKTAGKDAKAGKLVAVRTRGPVS